jgi:two-component system, NtrC family, sensor histidine kinase HydH
LAESLFEELKRYVEFSAADEATLRSLHPVASPQFQRIAEVFYDRILAHAEARKALEGGESQVGRLKVSLVAWMDLLLQGPWDEAYFEKRAKIGRVHVRIALPQHYMFGAMNVLRREFNRVIDTTYQSDLEKLSAARTSVSKIIDLELAIMLHTYREDLLAQQARVERLSTFGQLVGTIGHELRNPLAVMESSLHILKSRLPEDERSRKHLDRIGDQIGVANGIISSLLDIVRDAPLGKQPVKLAEVVEHAVQAAAPTVGVELTLTGLGELPEIQGDPVLLRQLFLNLAQNAIQALPEGKGQVRIVGGRAGGMVTIVVEDSGPGVDAETRRRLFEPLVTTKKKGVGLGLAWVKRIVERHGGTIAYEPTGPGARFVIRLPA